MKIDWAKVYRIADERQSSAIEWTLKTVPLDALDALASNPRYLSVQKAEQLAISLNKFGMIDKPIINQDNTIIGGHQRIALMRDNGAVEAQCWYPNRLLSDDEVKELNIRLNKNTGDWDWDIMANEWDVEQLCDWGFTEKELAAEAPQPNSDAEPECARCTQCNQKIRQRRKQT